MIAPPPAINVYGCSAEYGNPSGHSLWAASFHFFVFLDLCHATNGPKRSNVFYGITLFFAVFFMFIIGFARFYEGVHSINQILYGWTIGLWIAFYLHFCFRDMIIDHIERLLSTKNNQKVPFVKLSLICGAIGVGAFLSQLLTYIFVEMTIDPSVEATYRINMGLTESCKKYATSPQSFNEKSIIISGLAQVAIGAYLGILI